MLVNQHLPDLPPPVPPLAWDQNRTAEPPVTQVGKGVAVAYPHADIAKAKRIC